MSEAAANDPQDDTTTEEVVQAGAVDESDAGTGAEDGASAADGANGADSAEAADGEVVVTIGDTQPQDDDRDADGRPAPQWLRDLRQERKGLIKSNREQAEEIRRLKAAPAAQPAAVVVGDEPTLEGCNYDAAKFKTDWLAWQGRKTQAESQAAEARRAQEEQAAEWTKKLDGYKQQKAALKVSDIESCEIEVRGAMSILQQSVLIGAADNPALIVAALGKNPGKLKELAAIQDPVKFAAQIGKLETQLKVIPRKTPATAPERTVRGGGSTATAVDNTLDRLRAEAAKTGDLSKVVAYKNQRRQQQKQA